MPTTMIVGPTGSGKTSALQQRYRQWVQSGIRTDQILVLTAGAVHTSYWRKGIGLPAHGPIEAHSFFGFVQRELNLFWAPIQAAIPPLRHWVSPEFLDMAVARRLTQGLAEPLELFFGSLIKAPPERIAAQIAANLATAGSAAGFSTAEMVCRLDEADRPEKGPLYAATGRVIELYRERCLAAGFLDYGLALQLFTGVLLQHGPYMDHLRARYRCLLVDDLDETVPVEQDFLARLAGQMEESVYAYNPDGGHTRFRGADPLGAYRRFAPGAARLELAGSHTCTPELFALGDALSGRIMGQLPERRFAGLVEEQIATELRPEMLNRVVAKVIELIDRGVRPGAIAIITPHGDKELESTARRAFAALPQPVALQSLTPSRRLVDEPHVRAIIALAGLAAPAWKIPLRSPGMLATAMQIVLNLDPIRAALVGDSIWRAGGLLPDLEKAGLRSRISAQQARGYEQLRSWITEARQKDWKPDHLVQALILEVLAPLAARLGAEQLSACQQLLTTAARFRTALERFGEGSFGNDYVTLLTEATATLEPIESYDPGRDAVTFATPLTYLSHRLSSEVQIWVDLSGAGWFPNDVKELANPHVLSRHWQEGERWTDARSEQMRQASAARIVRALVRRCAGKLVLAECSLSPWGLEQEGGLSEAFADLVAQRGDRL